MLCTPLHCCHLSLHIAVVAFGIHTFVIHLAQTIQVQQKLQISNTIALRTYFEVGIAYFTLTELQTISVGWSKHDVHLANVLLAVFLRLSQPSVHGRQHKHKLLAVIADTE